MHVVTCVIAIMCSSLILPLPQNVIDYLLDDGTLVVAGRYVNFT